MSSSRDHELISARRIEAAPYQDYGNCMQTGWNGDNELHRDVQTNGLDLSDSKHLLGDVS